jgi:uncharacterized protein
MVAHDDRGQTAPAGVGIGLRTPHVAEILATRPAVAFLEVHPENYFGGGPALAALERLRCDYPLSLHGVGLSLGGSDALDTRHLARLARLVERLDPVLVSEHLAWSVVDGVYLNHLLPLPYDEESLDTMCSRVDQAQQALGRKILVENPSRYLRFRHSRISEPEFLGELARRTGCGILLDVNNIYVSCRNFEEDPLDYLDAMSIDAVGEIHLAGHSMNDVDGRTILIDDHGSRVAKPVWQLYARTLERCRPLPTLVEWDTNLPDLAVLLEEAATAQRSLDAVHCRARNAVAA